MDKRTILVLNIAVIVVSCIVMFCLYQISLIVHGLLYEYGLQFSYEWAILYWACEKAAVLLLILIIGVNAVSAAVIFLPKSSRTPVRQPLVETQHSKEDLFPFLKEEERSTKVASEEIPEPPTLRIEEAIKEECEKVSEEPVEEKEVGEGERRLKLAKRFLEPIERSSLNRGAPASDEKSPQTIQVSTPKRGMSSNRKLILSILGIALVVFVPTVIYALLSA